MARGRVVTINRKDLRGYHLPSGVRLRSNPGVTALMSVSNRRGAYRKHLRANLKITGGTVGGLKLRRTPPKKHRLKGALLPKHYAGPGYRYPVRTQRRGNESLEHWHQRDRKLVRRALSYFGQHKRRYSPQVQRIIECNIAKAAKAVGQDSPKANEYRVSCGLDVRKNGGDEMSLYFRRVPRKGVRRRPRLRRNESLPRFHDVDEMFGEGPTRRDYGARPTRRRPAGYFGDAPTTRMEKPRKRKPRKPSKSGAPRASSKPSSSRGGSSMAGKKKTTKAKSKRSKTGKITNPSAKTAWGKRGLTKAEYMKKRAAAAKRTRKTNAGKAKPKTTKPSKKATKSGTRKRRTYKRKMPRTPSGKSWVRTPSYRGRVAKGRKGKGTGKRKARKASAKKAPSKKAPSRKPSKGKKPRRKSRAPAGLTDSFYGFTSNRRHGRRRGFRRNESFGGLASSMVKPVLVGAGGYAVHRIGTATVSALLGSIVSPTIAKLASAVLVAGVGGYLANKFLPKHAFNATLGMGLSAFGVAVKQLVPDFAEYAGFGNVQAASLLPRYSLSGAGQYYQAASGRDPFLQAAAGDPFLQAAAGEYYSTPQLGEYFSQDLFPVPGAEGSFAMSKIDVQGDTGAYEFHEAFSGTDAAPVYEGISPNANMDAAFNFMEAASGVGSRSNYVPNERALPVGARSTNQEEGIFDQGGIFAG